MTNSRGKILNNAEDILVSEWQVMINKEVQVHWVDYRKDWKIRRRDTA